MIRYLACTYVCAPLAWLLALGGCSGVRMQKPEEALRQLSITAEAQARKACQQYTDNEDYRQCVQRTEREFREARESGRTR